MTTDSPRWCKSSYSDNGGQCIEVAVNLAASRGVVPVRDSKDRGGPVLGVATGAFASFVAGVKAGRFGSV
ncbi:MULTISPECIES: DUF397 domain-containing protein [Streptomyces]|uniref:DUF397 domain-containing protein n=1 Tax=Streptomyces salyersiae TaxID=3075530 RepID=A0ABU2RD31_9ACTN|nr:DUF397 domain-containing protein [Streptomyces sp. DSM 41770]MDT0426714.1 DUF397 domain-containing protein [Streptomyces sp. DSM 41770]